MTDKNIPLVMDVDGTFLRTDLLYECFWAGLSKAPTETFSAIFRNGSNLPALKRDLAEIAQLRLDLMPVNVQLKALADENIASGRKVVLASASDQSLIDRLVEVHGFDADSFGSDGETNFKSTNKAERLVAAYGEAGFDYAGDSSADLKVWPHAQNALIVGGRSSYAAKMAEEGKTVTHYSSGWTFRGLAKAFRPHQWVKNILLFLPLLAAQQFDLVTMLAVLWGVVAFSAAASSIYIVNDLLDLEADRLHETKHRRPFASGAVPIQVGMVACMLSGLFALFIAATLNSWFFGMILLYMVLSLTYSVRWKRMRWIDIATLATLYTLRVVAGAAAGAVFVSGSLLVFIFPIFLTLGCVKRLTEVTRATSDARLPGRAYSRRDRGDLLNISWLGVVGALATFLFYSQSAQAKLLYPETWLLWVALIPIAAWLIRMVRIGYLGKMDYDPIVFALRDAIGIALLVCVLALMFLANGAFLN